jgi:hypothetical protein
MANISSSIADAHPPVMPSIAYPHPAGFRYQQFLQLTKPRVVSLIVFTAMIGMLLAASGMIPLRPFVFGAIGIALIAEPRQRPIACWSRKSKPGWPARALGHCLRRCFSITTP